MKAEINPYKSIGNSLATSFIGKNIIYYPRIASTMDIARQEAKGGACRGTVIIAGEQTEARGRMKRNWLTPKGNIALSIILYPDISFLPYLVMIASLAVVYSIETVTGLKPEIKWPNDVLIRGKKVCGILVESDVMLSRAIYALVGIGINVGLRSSDYADISAIATSLNDESGGNVSRVEVVRNILTEVERLYLKLPDGEHVYTQWRDKMVTLGKKVRVESGNKVLEGIAESVDRSGAMTLRHADGSMTKIVAGDVTTRE